MAQSRKSDFVSQLRQTAKDFMRVLDQVAALNREYQANGATAWLDQADLVGIHAELVVAELETAMGNLAQINTYVANQNVDDTLYKVF